MRHTLLSFVSTFAIVVAVPAMAAEIDASSQVDAVTVYPDGATVTRLIRLDLPSGDLTLLAKDFPLTLDPSSLRVEGEAGRAPRDRRGRGASAAASAGREHSGDRSASRDAARRARRARRRDRIGDRRGASLPCALPRRRRPGLARRARRGR